MPRLILLALGALIWPIAADDSETASARPVAVFASLDGKWQGTFVGFDESGKELYRIRVQQTYEITDDHTQKVTVRDTMPDGSVITGVGENTASRRADGTLVLGCVVRKSNGEKAEHEGRLVRGPDGDEQIIWHSKKEGRVETFRETVRKEGDGFVYEINGMGRYGETLMLMSGRYRKQ